MINKIIYGFFDFAYAFVDVFTAPINTFINDNLPDVSSAFDLINSFFHSIENGFSWFVYLIPTNTLVALTIFLTLFVGGYSIALTIKFIQWVIDLVKRANIFTGK